MGLSAKKEKDDRFQQIKKEVVEMIKMQAPSMESKVYYSYHCYLFRIKIKYLYTGFTCPIFSFPHSSYFFSWFM